MAGPERAEAIASVERMSAEFLAAFDVIAQTSAATEAIKPLPCSLSTCTFAGALAFADGPSEEQHNARFKRIVEQLYDAADLMEALGGAGGEDAFRLVREEDGAAQESDGDDENLPKKRKKRAAEPKKKFHNQVSLRRGTKSIKIFKNGSVHGTGCASPMLFYDMVDSFCAYLGDVADADDLGEGVFLRSFKFGMINAMFVINDRAGRLLKIRLEALTNLLTALPPVEGVGRIEQNLEFHPGAKIPLFPDPADRSKKITIRIFQTGSVYIAGAREPAHVALAHAHACRVLDEHAAAVCYPDAKVALRSTTARQGFQLLCGYVYNQFEACYSNEAAERMDAATMPIRAK